MENLCGCNIINVEKLNVEDDLDGPFPFGLTDQDVFNCSICYQPLTIPVFQCREGHLTCSSCTPKVEKIDLKNCPLCDQPVGELRCHPKLAKYDRICPSCDEATGEYIRCRGIEKVMEAIIAPCKYRKFGCKETMQICNRRKHFTSCPFSQFECPLPTCNFTGSYSDWHSHVSQSTTEHMLDVTKFSFDTEFQVKLDKTKRCWILRCNDENIEYGIFVLNNFSCAHGNALTISRVAPSHRCNRPCYDISVSLYGEPSCASVSQHSSADCIQEKVVNRQPPKKTLFVPNGFDLGGTLYLEVSIKKLDALCGKIHLDKQVSKTCGYKPPNKS